MSFIKLISIGAYTFVLISINHLPGYAQNDNSGNCVIQNSNTTNTTNNVTCYSASPFGGHPGFDFPGDEISVPLISTVSDLKLGSNTFTITIENKSNDANIELHWRDLSIIDNEGNYYLLDKWAAHGTGFTRLIPPNQLIKLNYTLESAISNNAKQVTFTYDNMWAQPVNSAFQLPLQNLQWTVVLE